MVEDSPTRLRDASALDLLSRDMEPETGLFAWRCFTGSHPLSASSLRDYSQTPSTGHDWWAGSIYGEVIADMTLAQIGFWITGSYCPASFLIWSLTSINVAGRTKKSVVQALNFFCWCLGFLLGPQAFQSKDAPAYRPGLYVCCACFLLCGFILLGWFFWVRWENGRRDKRAQDMGLTPEQVAIEGCLFGLQDKTDRQSGYSRLRQERR